LCVTVSTVTAGPLTGLTPLGRTRPQWSISAINGGWQQWPYICLCDGQSGHKEQLCWPANGPGQISKWAV